MGSGTNLDRNPGHGYGLISIVGLSDHRVGVTLTFVYLRENNSCSADDHDPIYTS